MNYQVSLCRGCRKHVLRVEVFIENTLPDCDPEDECEESHGEAHWSEWFHVTTDYGGRPYVSVGDQFHSAEPTTHNMATLEA